MTDDATMSRADLAKAGQASPDGAPSGQPILHVPGRAALPVTDVVTVGRQPEGEGLLVAIDGDLLVSKAHARIEAGDGAFQVTDLESSNGTSVVLDGAAIQLASGERRTVPSGTEIVVGDTVLRVEYVGTGPTDQPPPVAEGWPGQDDDGSISAVPGAATAALSAAGVAVSEGHSAMPAPGASTDPTGLPATDQGGDWLADVGGAPPSSYGPPGSAPVPAPPVQPSPVPPPGASPGPSDCSSCGQPLVAGARFCDSCGTPVAPPPAAAPGTAPDPGSTDRKHGGLLARLGWPVLLAGGVAVLVVILVIAGLIAVLGGDDGGGSGGDAVLESAPDDPEERWSERVDDGFYAGLGGDGDSIVVAMSDVDELHLAVFDAGNGDERWSTDLDASGSAGLDVVANGVVLAYACDGEGGDCETTAFDLDDGEELWQDDFEGSFYRYGNAVHYRESDRIAIVDVESGDLVESVRADSIIGPVGGVVLADDGDEVEVFSASNLESVFGPVDVDEDLGPFGFGDGNLLAADGDELLFIDGDGETVADVDLGVDVVYDLDTSVPGMVLVESDEGVLAFDLDGADTSEVWDADGSYFQVLETDAGLVVPIRDEDRLTVYDARTGEERFELDDYDVNSHDYAHNALLDGPYDDETWEVVAYDWSDGEELWELDVDGTVSVVAASLVAVYEDEVTLYR